MIHILVDLATPVVNGGHRKCLFTVTPIPGLRKKNTRVTGGSKHALSSYSTLSEMRQKESN